MPIDRPLLAVPAVICRNTIATGVSSEGVVLGSLREKPLKIGTKVVSPGRYVTFGSPIGATSGRMFKGIVMLIAPSCGGHLRQRDRRWGQIRQTTTAEARFDEGKATSPSAARQTIRRFGCQRGWLGSNFVAARLDETENHTQ